MRGDESTSRTATLVFVIDAVQELSQLGRIESFDDRRII
jgi:hypothetical protein